MITVTHGSGSLWLKRLTGVYWLNSDQTDIMAVVLEWFRGFNLLHLLAECYKISYFQF